MEFLSFLWSFLTFNLAYVWLQSGLSPDLSLDQAITQMGVAGVIFIIWAVTFRFFSKNQATNNSMLHEKYQKTLEENNYKFKAALDLMHAQNREMLNEQARRYDEIIKRIESVASTNNHNLLEMMNRQFSIMEKDHEFKEAILGAIVEVNSQLKHKGN